MKLRLTMLLISSFLVSSASAQTPSEVTVLRAARMLDVVAGEIVKDAVVVIEGERIVSVNPSSTPGGAKILDLGDVTLLPGLMDLHTHLGHDLEPGFWMLEVVEGPADVAYRSVGNARKTLMAGFTTVRDFGGQVTVALSRAEEKGRVQSPRVNPSRNSLGITGGHCDATGFAPGIRELGTRGRDRRRRRRGDRGGSLSDQARRESDQDVCNGRRSVLRGASRRPAIFLRGAPGDGGGSGAPRGQSGCSRARDGGDHRGGPSRASPPSSTGRCSTMRRSG